VGVKFGNFKGEILVAAVSGETVHPWLASALSNFTSGLQQFLPEWKVELKDLRQVSESERPDVVILPYVLIGRPSRPNYGEFMNRAKLISKNVIYAGIHATAALNQAATWFTIPEEYDHGGFESPNGIQPYNFTLVVAPRTYEVYMSASQNIQNIRKFKEMLETYVVPNVPGGMMQNFPQIAPLKTNYMEEPRMPRRQSDDIPLSQTRTKSELTQAKSETQELRVQIAEVTNDEARLRTEVAQLGAQNLAQRETIARLEREIRLLTTKHEEMRAECSNTVESLRRILSK
jgi:hypothetical protein